MFKDNRFRHTIVERQASNLRRSFSRNAQASSCHAIRILRQATRGFEDQDYDAIRRCYRQGLYVSQFVLNFVEALYLACLSFYRRGLLSLQRMRVSGICHFQRKASSIIARIGGRQLNAFLFRFSRDFFRVLNEVFHGTKRDRVTSTIFRRTMVKRQVNASILTNSFGFRRHAIILRQARRFRRRQHTQFSARYFTSLKQGFLKFRITACRFLSSCQRGSITYLSSNFNYQRTFNEFRRYGTIFNLVVTSNHASATMFSNDRFLRATRLFFQVMLHVEINR